MGKGGIEVHVTGRACRMIIDVLNPPYFVSSSESLDKNTGQTLSSGRGLQIVTN